MINPKLFFHNNIRFLRERKILSQEALAQELDLSRNKLQALESGKTVNPTAADLVKFSSFFRISIDHLLKIDLAKAGELRVREYETRSDQDMSGKALRVIVTTVDTKGKQHIEHVPKKARAGYLAGYGDPEYISSLPLYSLPGIPKDRKFRSFPIEGDSMHPFPENAIVIGEYLDNWISFKGKFPCIVVTKNDGIVFKVVHNKIKEKHSLLLESLNPLYAPYEVAVDEVMEIWKYHSYISEVIPDAPDPAAYRILSKLDEMQTDLKKIRKSIG